MRSYCIGLPRVFIIALPCVACLLPPPADVVRLPHHVPLPLQPMWSSPDDCNRVTGKIRLGQEALATIDGKWDGQMHCTDRRTNVSRTRKVGWRDFRLAAGLAQSMYQKIFMSDKQYKS